MLFKSNAATRCVSHGQRVVAPDQRMPHRSGLALIGLVACLAASSVAVAEITSSHITYDEKVKRTRTFGQLDENLFGDGINLQDGAVSFTQNDVVLSTNSSLQVMLGRRTPSSDQGRDGAFAVFGRDWELNVPFMVSTVDQRYGWNTPKRCATSNHTPQEFAGPYPYYYTQIIPAHMYWHGINISIPGHGEEQLLEVNAGQTMPASGGPYFGTTKSFWRIGCTTSIKNGTGDGFAVLLPNGTTYYFDWMAVRNAVDLTDNAERELDYADSWHRLAGLNDYFLYATKAVDRFGNSIAYNYDPAKPNRLTSIVSNDGVRLDVEYNATGQVSRVTSGTKAWLYAYVADVDNFQRLQSVTLPDGAAWTFNVQNRMPSEIGALNYWSNACGQDPQGMVSTTPPDPNKVETVTITHPSGAVGVFKFRGLYHGTNNTPGRCKSFGSSSNLWFGVSGIPDAYPVRSLYSKVISGPSVVTRSWSYMYYPTFSFAALCGKCATTSQTTVQTADQVLRRYTFGNSYSSNLGQLLAETVEAGGNVARSRTYNYLTSASGQPFYVDAGTIPTGSTYSGNLNLYGNPFKYLRLPLVSTATQLDGVTMSRTVSAFNAFANPIAFTASSSLGYTKSVSNEFFDDTLRWVIGQLKRSFINDIEASKVDFDLSGLPWMVYNYGVLAQSLTYNADGTVATVSDGNGRTTTLRNWYRGMPRNIGNPDGTAQSAVIADSGLVASMTDQLGYTTSYGYDAMDRLTRVTYPTADSTAWNDNVVGFAQVGTAEFGIPAGHWKRVESTGNGRVTTFFNALLQPVLVLTEDVTNSATRSYVVSRYDTNSRLSFVSYPVPSLVSVDESLNGVSSTYDSLGRPVQVSQATEQGALLTTTQYLSGFRIRVINPRGSVSTASYQVFDEPNTDAPVSIINAEGQPEQQTTTITRDVFGKPMTITRSGG